MPRRTASRTQKLEAQLASLLTNVTYLTKEASLDRITALETLRKDHPDILRWDRIELDTKTNLVKTSHLNARDLTKLAKSTDPFIRVGVAAHHRTPTAVRVALLDDEVFDVQLRAREGFTAAELPAVVVELDVAHVLQLHPAEDQDSPELTAALLQKSDDALLPDTALAVLKLGTIGRIKAHQLPLYRRLITVDRDNADRLKFEMATSPDLTAADFDLLLPRHGFTSGPAEQLLRLHPEPGVKRLALNALFRAGNYHHVVRSELATPGMLASIVDSYEPLKSDIALDFVVMHANATADSIKRAFDDHPDQLTARAISMFVGHEDTDIRRAALGHPQLTLGALFRAAAHETDPELREALAAKVDSVIPSSWVAHPHSIYSLNPHLGPQTNLRKAWDEPVNVVAQSLEPSVYFD